MDELYNIVEYVKESGLDKIFPFLEDLEQVALDVGDDWQRDIGKVERLEWEIDDLQGELNEMRGENEDLKEKIEELEEERD
jgi:predicted RNase H-like nuclease (RuvC/YqgF family)